MLQICRSCTLPARLQLERREKLTALQCEMITAQRLRAVWSGNMQKSFGFLCLCLVSLSGCSSSSNNATNLVVIGNSITLHAPNPAIGWYGDWGMAAPAAEMDFSHLVAGELTLPLSVNNLGIESQPTNSLPQIPVLAEKVGPGTIVILELGDNAPFGGNVAGFESAYEQLAATMGSKGGSLVCVSTWWHYQNIDEMVQTACEAHSGHYVYIGDLFTDPDNTDRQSTAYSNWQVNDHPRQWGHLHIAERVLDQIRGQ